MSYLLIDKESRSKASLPDVGQYKYARHGSTEIMCIGWKIIGEKGDANLLTYPDIYLNENTKEFKYALKHCKKVVAHNVPFEIAMWNNCLVPTTGLGSDLPILPPDKFICTLATSNVLALPRSLDKVGEVLNLKVQKDVAAKKLLLSMCKPRKAINDIKAWREWVEDDASLNGLYKYCKVDVLTEEQLFLELMANNPWTNTEYNVWVLDQIINQRGFRADIPLIKRITELIEHEETELTHDLKRLTFGWVGKASQNKNLQEYFKTQGLELPNLQAATVESTIQQLEKNPHVSNEDVLKVLRIKKALSKSSTSKYQAFLDRADTDDRVRDNLMYHGASTGRWAGMGVQPQNFPRGTIKMTPDVLEDIRTQDIQMLRLLYNRPMDLFSSALRNMIVASEGKEFFCADFSSIEARVLLWVARDTAGLLEYEKGLDTYISMASVVYGVPYKEIEAEYLREGYSERRQLGKKIILACGYQMGIKKFIEECRKEGITLPESILIRAHKAFKEKYPKVPQTWFNLERTAKMAVINKGKKFSINQTTWYVKGDFLFCRLPSGRKLSYYKPEVRVEASSWGEDRPTLYYWTVDSKTKQWVCRASYGGLLTENVVQAISRDCMALSMTRVEDNKYEVLLTVHDEVLCERDKGTGTLKEFKDLMSTRPDWGKEIPLKVGGWVDERYHK